MKAWWKVLQLLIEAHLIKLFIFKYILEGKITLQDVTVAIAVSLL
jgi:hypothetical protein